MADDIYLSEQAIMSEFKPDHINIASIGQLVPHLHWHIIPRYLDDPRWGGPIWTTSMDEMQKVYLAEDDYAKLVQRIRVSLGPL
jgi:diadenosine tetraphosphate (Ap4A) HIT family hydrolase